MAEAQTESALEKPADKARDAPQKAPSRTVEAVDNEVRSFTEGARNVAGVAQRGLEAGGDLARRSVEATRQMAEQGRQTSQEIANVWRDAVNPLFGAQLEASRWLEHMWRQATGLAALPALRPARPLAAFSSAPLFGLPPVDVKETEQAYELSVELPGVKREDVELTINGDLLTLCGSKAEARQEGNASYRLSERRFGRFERSFPIPPGVNKGAIEATFNDGVLSIALRKAGGAAPPARVDIR